MIGTHAPKLFSARSQQPGVRARIVGKIPQTIVCSSTVNLRRELWALPKSAASIRVEREDAADAQGWKSWDPILPDKIDPQTKQIFLPREDWRNGEYCTVSPVASCGVIFEAWNRVKESGARHVTHTIQPTVAALANHGECLLAMGGSLRLMPSGPRNPKGSTWVGDFVEITGRVERMNIASGMLALGWPSIAAVGGLVHALERESGCDIEFAFGMRSCDWGNALRCSELRRSVQNKSQPVVVSDEITGVAEIVILLRGHDIQKITSSASGITRLAGGSMFDLRVRALSNSPPPEYAYLRRSVRRGDGDALATAIQRYKESEGRVSLNLTGYAFLEAPKPRPDARGPYYHAWSEPLFSSVKQGPLTEAGWWRRKSTHNTVRWTQASQ